MSTCRFAAKANKLNSLVFEVFLILCFAMIGLFVALAIKAESHLSMAIYLVHPISVYILAVMLCILGQYFADSVRILQCSVAFLKFLR